MRVALAQVNSTIGDVRGNLERMRNFYDRACDASNAAGGADIVVFPELVLPGYPPRDLLEQGDFVDALGRALAEFAAHCTRAPALVGTVRPTERAEGRPLYNTAAFLSGGEVRSYHDKVLLPTYDVFDEDRYFERGGSVRPLPWGDGVGVAICEDLWNVPDGGVRRYSRDIVGELQSQGVETILAPSASPYHSGQGEQREYVFAQQASRLPGALLVCNSVGGHTELIFDGGSLAMTAEGIRGRACRFEEDLFWVETAELRRSAPRGGEVASVPLPVLGEISDEERVSRMADALVLGIRDYFRKCGFGGAVIGLSGGIDSAVTAALAVQALGPEGVCGVGMPSRYSSEGSVTDARELAQRLGIEFHLVPIEPIFSGALQTLAPVLGDGVDQGVTPENLQARARGQILMAISNARGSMVLATGNKSELAVGYCTLYGDMCGGLGPIGDVPKTDVYRMAALPRFAAVIPESTRTKPPSAELRPGQLDEDSLPPYEQLDAILELYVDEQRGAGEIVEAGFDQLLVQDVLRKVDSNEYKRRQAAPVLRVTSKAFGVGRRLPIACRRNW